MNERVLPEKLWRCDCGADVLGLSFYTWKDEPMEWFIEFYSLAGRRSRRWRLKQIVNLLLDREVVIDSVALSETRAREMVAFLPENIAGTDRSAA